jgi:hypothetical protein
MMYGDDADDDDDDDDEDDYELSLFFAGWMVWMRSAPPWVLLNTFGV